MDANKPFRTMIGGQALIEGILMRGPGRVATVVRKPDGTMDIKEEPCKVRKGVLTWPFIRGVVGLWDSLSMGMSALTYSSEVAFEGIEEEPGWLEKKIGKEKADKLAIGIALVVGCALPVALFILLPTLLAGTLDHVIGSGIWRNLLEGALRLLIFFLFLFAVSRMNDIKRTFSYHGAEHKSIHCYEHGLPLTVENVQKFPKEHPRCGTSFLFVVMIVSILVFSLVTWSNPLIRMLLRLVLLPVVISIGYEINRAVGRHDNLLTRILRAPGLWMQHLTTNEPDDSMVEVAVTALERVIPEHKGDDTW